jgi:type I restriction-modification system DNA methylase subunit
MDIKELENWLWDIASILRGPIEAYNYKDYIFLSYSYGARNLEL